MFATARSLRSFAFFALADGLVFDGLLMTAPFVADRILPRLAPSDGAMTHLGDVRDRVPQQRYLAMPRTAVDLRRVTPPLEGSSLTESLGSGSGRRRREMTSIVA